jgi:glucose 1-dehydrogenase
MNPAAPFSLSGRRALITGSSRGIGRAIALAFLEAGADVAIHGWNDRLRAEETAQIAASLGRRSCVIQSDLGSETSARITYEQAVAGLDGSPDILVCNVSVQIPAQWTAITPADLERQIAVNYRSTFELLQLALPVMAERKWGRVLTIGSVQERVPNPEMLVYSSLKNAQTALGFSLAKQYASHGVTVNNLAPGVIETDRYHDRVKTPAHAEHVLAWIPAGYVGQPADCAGAALLLCSDAGRYITGQNLFVDGGMSL